MHSLAAPRIYPHQLYHSTRATPYGDISRTYAYGGRKERHIRKLQPPCRWRVGVAVCQAPSHMTYIRDLASRIASGIAYYESAIGQAAITPRMPLMLAAIVKVDDVRSAAAASK